MALIFNLILLGIVAIGFIKIGGTDFISSGFSDAKNFTKQINESLSPSKDSTEKLAKNRSVDNQ